jgi:hypothetical protein
MLELKGALAEKDVAQQFKSKSPTSIQKPVPSVQVGTKC